MSGAAHRPEYTLGRFIEAQRPIIDSVRTELAAGHKRTHWMWFVFPQIRGLGHSPTAQNYAIDTLAQAEAYLRHPVLGARLRECTQLVCASRQRTIEAIFGYPDNLKFHSCMTLFATAAGERPEDRIFRAALDKYFSGREDPRTLELLRPRGARPLDP